MSKQDRGSVGGDAEPQRLTWGDVGGMSGRAADIRSSGDDRDPRRPGSQRRQSQHRGQGPLWLHGHRQTDGQTGREIRFTHLSSET